MKNLTGPSRARYRLSPNEVEQLRKEETDRRRKLRILQVREQAKSAAAKIRNDVKQERERQLLKLAKQVEEELQNEKQEEVMRLEKQYENTLRTVGQAHLQAKVTDKSICHLQQHQVALENKQKADLRHQEALRKLAVDKAYKTYEDTKNIRNRHSALEQEKKRAAEVAARPPPAPDVVSEVMGESCKPSKPIPLTDLNAFSATHYHIPEFAVERAPQEQQHDGKLAGEGEDGRVKEELEEKAKREHDQMIRARIRGNEALKKEKLKHEYDALMADLSLQQRLDRRRRQGVVAKLPKQVFVPPDRRLEEKEDKQLEMERAFEDMYMQQMNVSGDMSLTLDTVPLSSLGEDSTSATENSPVIVPSLPRLNPALKELTNVSRSQRQGSQEGKPETTLKRLLSKIKEQRSEAEESRVQPASCDLEHAGKKPQEDKHRSRFQRTATGQSHSAPSHSATRPDPQLDLSPLKSPSNEKPQKQKDLLLECKSRDVLLQQPSSPAPMKPDGDAGDDLFLEGLKERLQTLEAQKDYLDKKMKDQQKEQRCCGNTVSVTTTISSAPQHRQATAASHPLISDHISLSQAMSDKVGAQSIGQPRFSTLGNGGKPHSEPQILSKPVPETEPARETAGANVDHLPFHNSFGLGPSISQSQSLSNLVFDARHTLLRGAGLAHPVVDLQPAPARFSTSISLSSVVGQTPFGPSYSSAAPVGGLTFSTGQVQTLSSSGPAGSVGQNQGQSAVAGSVSTHTVGARPAVVTSVRSLSEFPPYSTSLTSHLTRRTHQPVTTHASSSAVPTVPVFSKLTGRTYQPLATSLSSAQYPGKQTVCHAGGDGNINIASLSGSFPCERLATRSETLVGAFGSQLGSGFSEQEGIQRIREYQRQLAEKHAERMRSLAEMRMRIESGQIGRVESMTPSLSELASGLRQLPDPAVLAPYTLHTSSEQPSRFSASAITATDALKPSTAAGLPNSSRAHHATSSMQGAVMSSLGVSDGGDEFFSTATVGSLPSASKLDSIRRSLPFENPDESQLKDDDECAGGASMADDSHLSSSTERGSPALASHSKSMGSQSVDSDGSIGASSLIARAEEKRLNFEHRRQELQEQLEEIQRKKDELLQHYRSRQLQVSFQETDLRGKLHAAQTISTVSVTPTPAQALASSGDATTHFSHMTAGQALPSTSDTTQTSTASPSMELEEQSFSSRGSGIRSWANILEDFSSQNRNQGIFKSSSSMTLEELSFTSSDMPRRPGENGLSSSSTSVPQERSIFNGNGGMSMGSASLEEHLSTQSSLENLATLPHLSSQNYSNFLPKQQQNSGSVEAGTAAQPWLELLKSASSATEDDLTTERLPPPTSRSAVLPIVDYQPHELSTIIEVDTPQTGNKTVPVIGAAPSLPLAAGGTAGFCGSTGGGGARRCIDFSKHISAGEEEKPPESRFSASGGSGSSGSSGKHTVIEVVHHIPLPGSNLLIDLGRPLADTDKFNRESWKAEEFTKRGPLFQAEHSTGQGLDPLQTTTDGSSLSSGFEFFPLDLTSTATHSTEESHAQGFLDFSKLDAEPRTRPPQDEHAKEVLRKARQFNQDLMAAIKQHADDVFDQSSLMSLSHSNAEDSVSSRT